MQSIAPCDLKQIDLTAITDPVQRAVAYRVNQGKASVMAALIGCRAEDIVRFAETGECERALRHLLEVGASA